MKFEDIKAGRVYYLSTHEFIIIHAKNGEKFDYTSVYMDRSTNSPTPLRIERNKYAEGFFEKIVPHLKELKDLELQFGSNHDTVKRQTIFFLFETDAKR